MIMSLTFHKYFYLFSQIQYLLDSIINSRTLTSVHDNILEDLVYPAEIVGKRIRFRLDASKLMKVHLDTSNKNSVEHKVRHEVILMKMIITCIFYRLKPSQLFIRSLLERKLLSNFQEVFKSSIQ